MSVINDVRTLVADTQPITMQKILFLSTLESTPWGGSEQLWSDMALRLIAQRYLVMTCTLEWEHTPQKIQEINKAGGITIFRPNVHKHINIIGRASNKLKGPKWKDEITAFEPDVIFINQGGTFDNALMQHGDWLLSFKKKVYVLSNFMPEFDYESEQYRNFFSSYFKKVEQLWFVSRRSKEVAERVLASKIDNSIIIQNPIKLKEIPETYPTTDTYNMAVVARLETDIKGFDILISTFVQPQWKDRNYCVNIYGSGMHEAYLKELVAFYDLTNKIIFKGFVNDVVQIWQDNHILLLSSRGEGTPLSLLEANYCKRAAVVTDVGGNADVIEDGYNGFVADAPAIKCFSKAMERAWEQREQWQQMGEHARTNLDKNHTDDAVRDALKLIGIEG